MYKPRRDHRFEYVADVLHFIEINQCRGCAFSGSNFPMCDEIAIGLMLEHTIPDLDDLGDDGVVCRRYRDAELAEQEHPDQGRLL